jgi:hypothetical protein
LISGRLREFDAAMRARTTALESCHARQVEVCQVEPLANAPASFAAADVSANAADWINLGYARYFKLREVTTAAVDPDVRH